MRLKFLVLLLMIFALLFDVSLAAKDRKRNRNKNRNDDTTEDDEGSCRDEGEGKKGYFCWQAFCKNSHLKITLVRSLEKIET